MRNMLALVGLLVVGFAGIGWYCGWYKLRVNKNPSGNIEVQTEVDTKKVAEDSSAFFHKVGQVIGERADKSGQPTSAPVGTPGPASSSPGAPGLANAPATPTTFEGGWLTRPEQPSRPLTGNR